MQPIPDDGTPPGAPESARSFFEVIDADTTITRRRLVDALVGIAHHDGEAHGTLRIGGAAAMLSAAGRRTRHVGTMLAIDSYLEVARVEHSSLFSLAHDAAPDAPAAASGGIIAAQIDEIARRLARDRAPARLFGLVFAIERARQLAFASHPATFARDRSAGAKLAVAGTSHPRLTSRFAALINEAGTSPADRALIVAQAHAIYDVVERMLRASSAARRPTTLGIDSPARQCDAGAVTNRSHSKWRRPTARAAAGRSAR